MNRTCPPCDGACRQGRDCPDRDTYPNDSALWICILLVFIFLLGFAVGVGGAAAWRAVA